MKHNKERNKTQKNIKNQEKEIELDFSKVTGFFKNITTNKKIINYSWILLLIIPIFLAAHFRLYPADLPATEDWARNSIYSQIKSNIDSQITSQYPNLPAANKQKMINDNFNSYIEQNKAQIDQAVIDNAQYFKEQFKNSNGETYLLAIDPYHYYRETVNLVETGHTWDKEVDGIAYNDHMLAPKGSPVTKEFSGAGFHVWFGALWHKFISLFNNNISIMGSFFYVPVIISALSVIPAFFLARRVGGNLAGFFAAMIVGLHPSFLGRTAGGFSDTDAYNVLFPLLISWLFIEAYSNPDRTKKIILGGLAGLFVGIYSFAWSGWWYVFDFALAAMIGHMIYHLIVNRGEIKNGLNRYLNNEKIKNSAIVLVVFLVISGIFVSFFNSFGTFLNAPLAPITNLAIKDSAKADLWPNVYTTVAELNEASLASVINGIGGKIFFSIALLGMVMTLTRKDKFKANLGMIIGSIAWISLLLLMQSSLSLLMFIALMFIPVALTLLYYMYIKETNINVIYAIFFTLWFLVTIYTTTKGIRFLLLLVPVYGVSFGIAIGKIYQYIVEYAHEELDLNKKIGSTITFLVLLLLLISPINQAKATALNEIPSMNDGWYNSLDKINKEAAPDAIINSWWDFGHWFKAIGDRAVTFDGASQNTPMAHWIGKTLLTSDENEAMGILRMLDCGSNDAFETLKKAGFDTVASVDILYALVLTRNDEQARDLLKDNNVDSASISKIIELSHCDPPENYFITSQDMIGKSGVWAHFGSWDFRRALVWNEYRNLPKQEFDAKTAELGYNSSESSKMYYEIQGLIEGRDANTWIAPWPSYASGLTGCSQKGSMLQCQSGLIVNLTSMDAYIPTQQGNLYPKKLSYNTVEGEFIVDEYDEKGTKVLTSNDGSFIGASLIRTSSGSYQSILMQEQLVDSMFNRLFYYEGAGLDHFEKFSDLRDVTGARIIVWKVDWEGKQE